MRNNVFLQIKVESESQNSSKLIKIHSTSQRKDCLNLLHLWVRQLLTTWGNAENPPDVKSWTCSLLWERVLRPALVILWQSWDHTNAQLCKERATAGNSTSCHCRHPGRPIPALCAHSATACAGSPTPAFSHILRSAEQSIFISWFLFKTTTWCQRTQGKRIYF